MRLGMTFGATDLSLFVNNLTDQHPLLNRYQDSVDSHIFTDTTLRPRTIGLSASFKF
jgi:outer membrane receptor protein involved in Fe transport